MITVESETFSIRTWIERALAFTQSLQGLAGKKLIESSCPAETNRLNIQDVNRGLRVPVPKPIEDFVVAGSAGLQFSYVWTPPPSNQSMLNTIFGRRSYLWGGGELCRVEDFQNSQDACYWWLLGGIIQGCKRKGLEFWLRSFPFLPIRNGDFLALDVDVESKPQPVIYLSHESPGTCERIAESFEQFLINWDRLNYIGPDLGMLEPFRNAVTGYIDGESPPARVLRELFLEGKR
jgi:hypothetical protein